MKIVHDVPGERLELRSGAARFFKAFPGDRRFESAVAAAFLCPLLLLYFLRPEGKGWSLLVGTSLASVVVYALRPRPDSLSIDRQRGTIRYRECGAFGTFSRGWTIAMDRLAACEAIISVSPIDGGYGGQGSTWLRMAFRERTIEKASHDSKALTFPVEFIDKAEEATTFVFRFAAAAGFKYRRVIGNTRLPGPDHCQVVKIELLQEAVTGAVAVTRPGRAASYRSMTTSEGADAEALDAIAAELTPPFVPGLWTGRRHFEVWSPGAKVVLIGPSRLNIDWTRNHAGATRWKTQGVPLEAIRAIELRHWMVKRKGQPRVHSGAVEARLGLPPKGAETALPLLSADDNAWLRARIGYEADQQFEAFARELADALGVPLIKSFGLRSNESIGFGVEGPDNYRVIEQVPPQGDPSSGV